MNKKILLGLLAVLAVGFMLVPAHAAVPGSPLDQYNSGIPLEMITCDDDKVLMQSPSGRPICATTNTATTLNDRGYTHVSFMEGEIAVEENADVTTTSVSEKSKIDIMSEEFLNAKHEYFTRTVSPVPPLMNYVEYDTDYYPTVGESMEVTFTTVYGDYNRDLEYSSNIDEVIQSLKPHSEYDIPQPISIRAEASNGVFEFSDMELIIGTDNPRIIKPYDPETFNEMPVFGEVYTLKFTATAIKEGFSFIMFKGLDYDSAGMSLGFAIGNDEAASHRDYYLGDETYIDHMLPVAGQVTIWTPNTRDLVPGSAEYNATKFLTEEEFYEDLAGYYIEKNWTDEQIIEDLNEAGFDDFFKYTILKDYLNFDEQRIENLGVKKISFEDRVVTGEQSRTFTVSGRIQTLNF